MTQKRFAMILADLIEPLLKRGYRRAILGHQALMKVTFLG
jgi:hypothetical protein